MNWYMHKPESILVNEMHKILGDFRIEIDYLILNRRSDLALIDKKKKRENLPSIEFCHSKFKANEISIFFKFQDQSFEINTHPP